jgi:A/G-specific adenine glycosylase
LADPLRPEIHHAAMMELGQRICRPGVPDCQACPVARFCKTRKPEQLPLKSRKAVITAVDEHALWLRDAAGRVLLHHESGRRRTGLWKLPLRGSKECSQLPVIAVETYAITRYRVTLSVHDGRGNAAVPAPGDHWVAVGELDQLAMAAPFRRVLVRLLEDF